MSAKGEELIRTLVDRRIWAREIERFVPKRVFDTHAHLMKRANTRDPKEWTKDYYQYPDVTGTSSYLSDMRALLPGRKVRGLYMSFPTRSLDVDADNDFTQAEAMKTDGSAALMIVTPEMKTAEIEAYLDAHPNVVGFKPYLFYSTNRDVYDSRPREFLPERHVAIAHKRGLVIMFHMSRQGYMADPLNRKDLHRFNTRYPNARWILAHCARGFIPWTLRESLDFINAMENTWVGTSGVTAYETFDVLFSGIPDEKILFGTDNRRLRGQTIELGETWIVITEKTLANAHQHSKTQETVKLYEQLRAMARAARRNHLSKRQINNIFWNNAMALLAGR